MPPIRTQTITPTGFSLQTQAFGLLEISISQAGNTTTVTCRKNGVQEQAPTVPEEVSCCLITKDLIYPRVSFEMQAENAG